MNRIAESELIINSRGAVYHLDVRPEELAGTIITVGDPDRVKQVSGHFDSVECRMQHREFITHTGRSAVAACSPAGTFKPSDFAGGNQWIAAGRYTGGWFCCRNPWAWYR